MTRMRAALAPLPEGQHTRIAADRFEVSSLLPWEQVVTLVKNTAADLRHAGNTEAALDIEVAALVDLSPPKTGPLPGCPSYCAVHTAAGFSEDDEPSHKSAEWPSGVAIYGYDTSPPVIDLPLYDDCDAADARQLAADLLAAAAVLDAAAVTP